MKHHTLLKEHEKALRSGDNRTAKTIAEQISKNGGIEKYQHASQMGQLTSRGGDTSKVLVKWLQESGLTDSKPSNKLMEIRVLEVGCLSSNNAISKCSNVRLVRIDLHSTDPKIEEQDFMERPLPTSHDDEFDIISLSLVVNFVPDARSRGEMLKRTTQFLRTTAIDTLEGHGPLLFFTLPLSCVKNSRYMTASHLRAIMKSLGYKMLQSKSTMKIYYSLWQLEQQEVKKQTFNKKEIAPGRTRNNFSIIID